MSEDHASKGEESPSPSGRGSGLQHVNKILLVVLLVLAGVFYMRSLNQHPPTTTPDPVPAGQQTEVFSETVSDQETVPQEPATSTSASQGDSLGQQSDPAAVEQTTHELAAEQAPTEIPGEAEALEQLQRIFAPETLAPGKP